nr:MAG TPA: hypothetical protein [Caudoviricetes sp.]
MEIRTRAFPGVVAIPATTPHRHRGTRTRVSVGWLKG